jgi:SAM-dependent methyltransferase
MRVRQYRFRRCSECKSLFLAEPPSPERIDELYADQTYFANPNFDSPEADGFRGYLNYLDDRLHIEQKFDQILERIERWTPRGRLLDVGAGPGFLLSAAAARGWSALGLDVNPWAVAYGRRELRVDLRQGTLEAGSINGETFEAVTMMDVVEHIPDVDALIAAAAGALRRGGVLAVLTADAGSRVSRALRGRWPEVKRVPEHLTLFSVRGLRSLLERRGFEPLEWHSIGKTSSVATLVADVSPIAPAIGRPLQRLIGRSSLANRNFELDPRTKFVLYARRQGRA